MSNLIKRNTGIVFPVSDVLLLPDAVTVVHISTPDDALAAYLTSEESIKIALPLQRNFSRKALQEDDFYRTGVIFRVQAMENLEGGTRLKVKLTERIEVSDLSFEGGVIHAGFVPAPEDEDLSPKSQEEILGYIKNITRDISSKFMGAERYMRIIDEFKGLNAIMVYLSQFLQISNDEKYELLKMSSQKERSLRFLDYLLKQKESIELQLQINEKFTEKANKSYRESVLREQLRVIQEELGEGHADGKKDKDYAARIDKANMPPEVREAALEELDKLEGMNPANAEYNVIRNYLDLLLQLPWGKTEPEPINLGKARRILDEAHYGLDKVKERIIQHLAVMQLNKNKKGSILLLVGPPGTGKTSLGKSIAQALDRKYVRLSLGGIRDEAEIRGHRRTYVGAMPGRIIQSIKKAGVTNPVMVLDEVDKLMTGGFSGDPASALLEVLDPEQNSTFTDHYLDLPYDLSEVFFIATANSLDTIPGPLLDRMEVINISSYTIEEKFHIGKDHLIPEVLAEHGLTPEQLVIDDEVMRAVISDFTLEAGVRGLKKQLAALARVASEKIVSNKEAPPYVIRVDELEELLGRRVSRHDKAQQDNPPGVVTGLAWTPVGGEILFIEATDMPGSGEVTLTGKLGDVMKESARISLSLLKSRLPLNTVAFKERDLHIHVPSGAVPKDGPSAGIAIFTALASLVTGAKVDPKIAMTGEITLRGAVLPIGGVKEKLLGAQRAGITKVLIPKDNLSDLKDIPEEVLSQLTVVAVETVEDVLRETIGITLPRVDRVLLPGGTPGTFSVA